MKIDILSVLEIIANLLSTCKSNYAKIYETVQKYIPCKCETQRNVIFETWYLHKSRGMYITLH